MIKALVAPREQSTSQLEATVLTFLDQALLDFRHQTSLTLLVMRLIVDLSVNYRLLISLFVSFLSETSCTLYMALMPLDDHG